MEIKRLDNDFEKYLFLKEYNEKAKMNVPSSYIFECTVYGAFLNGEMLGGFAFAEGQDMVWPQIVPGSNQIFKSVPKEFCLEINLVWAKGPLHESAAHMIKFWATICRYASQVPGVEYITYAVDSSHTGLVKMYDQLATSRLFDGPIPKYPGRSAIVFYTSPMRCKLALLLCFKDILQKVIKKSRSLGSGPTEMQGLLDKKTA